MEVSIPQAVSTVATTLRILDAQTKGTVSIPQAVSTVATPRDSNVSHRIWRVSIPQAVSTVATYGYARCLLSLVKGFNTASGKYCCNSRS